MTWDFNTIKYLLLREADPNCLTEEGPSAFHIAVGLDDPEVSENITNLLLLNGGDPNLRDPDGITPLHIAAAFGRYEIVDALLGCGGDPHLQDSDGQTCMDLAVESGSDQCVALLRLYDKQDPNVGEVNKKEWSEKYERESATAVEKSKTEKPKPRKSIFKYTEQIQGLIDEQYDQTSFQLDVTSPDHPVLVRRTDLDSTYTVLNVHENKDGSLLEKTIDEVEVSGESFHTVSSGGSPQEHTHPLKADSSPCQKCHQLQSKDTPLAGRTPSGQVGNTKSHSLDKNNKDSSCEIPRNIINSDVINKRGSGHRSYEFRSHSSPSKFHQSNDTFIIDRKDEKFMNRPVSHSGHSPTTKGLANHSCSSPRTGVCKDCLCDKWLSENLQSRGLHLDNTKSPSKQDLQFCSNSLQAVTSWQSLESREVELKNELKHGSDSLQPGESPSHKRNIIKCKDNTVLTVSHKSSPSRCNEHKMAASSVDIKTDSRRGSHIVCNYNDSHIVCNYNDTTELLMEPCSRVDDKWKEQQTPSPHSRKDSNELRKDKVKNVDSNPTLIDKSTKYSHCQTEYETGGKRVEIKTTNQVPDKHTSNRLGGIMSGICDLTLNSTDFSLDSQDTQVLRDLTLNTTNCSYNGGRGDKGGGFVKEGDRGGGFVKEGDRGGGFVKEGDRGGGFVKEGDRGGGFVKEGDRGGGFVKEGDRGGGFVREGDKGGGFVKEGDRGGGFVKEGDRGGGFVKEGDRGGGFVREGDRGGGFVKEGDRGGGFVREGDKGGGFVKEGDRGGGFVKEGDRGGGFVKEGDRGGGFVKEGDRGGGFVKEGDRGGGFVKEGTRKYNYKRDSKDGARGKQQTDVEVLNEDLFTEDEDSVLLSNKNSKKRYAVRKDSGFSSSLSGIHPDETMLSYSTGMIRSRQDDSHIALHPDFYNSPRTSSRLPTPDSSPGSSNHGNLSSPSGSSDASPLGNLSIETPSLQCDLSDISLLRTYSQLNKSETRGKSQSQYNENESQKKSQSHKNHPDKETDCKSAINMDRSRQLNSIRRSKESVARSHKASTNGSRMCDENKSEMITFRKSCTGSPRSKSLEDLDRLLDSEEESSDFENTVDLENTYTGSTLIFPPQSESETVGKSQFSSERPRVRRLLSSASSTKSTSSTCSCKSVGAENHVLSDEDNGVSLIEVALPKDVDPDCSLHTGLNLSSDSTMLYDWQEEKLDLNSSAEVSTQSLPQVTVTSDIKQLSDLELRRELEQKGDRPGPITLNTRKIYEIRLARVKADPQLVLYNADKDEFCPELSKALQGEDINTADQIDTSLVKLFWDPKPTVNWREGTHKTSFTYLLMDPRVTQNLPARAKSLGELASFEVFVRSIFYVGKGQRSRPYAHFKEAIKFCAGKTSKPPSKKVTQIVSVWEAGLGVVSLHIFQNVIPVEAYTRECCLIQALGLKRLTNIQPGQVYGNVSGWSRRKQRLAGVVMLKKAYQIFLMEGERQIRAYDIKS